MKVPLPIIVALGLVVLACTREASQGGTRAPAAVMVGPTSLAEPVLVVAPTMRDFAGVLASIEARPPGAARDEAIARAEVTLAAWPDDRRAAPDAWLYDLVAGRTHAAWSLVRRVDASFLTAEAAVTMLQNVAMATITDLGIECSDDRSSQAGILVALRTSPHLGSVTSLRLRLAAGPELARVVVEEMRAGVLRNLQLRAALGAEGVAILAGAPALRQLARLDLSGASLSRADLEALVRSPHLRGLRSLVLTRADLDDEDVQVLAGGFPALLDLDLGDNHFGLAGLRALVGAPYFARLQRLDFKGADLGDAGGTLLAAGLGREMRELRLSDTRMGAEGVVALAGARQLAGLEVLDLSSDFMRHVGRKEGQALAAAGHLRRLREVKFSVRDDGTIGRDVFVALAAAPHLARHEERRYWLERAAIYDLTLSPVDAAAVVPVDAVFTVHSPGFHSADTTVSVFADGRVEGTGSSRGQPLAAYRGQVDVAVVRVLLADARRVGMPLLRVSGELQDDPMCTQQGAALPGVMGRSLAITLSGISQVVSDQGPCFSPEVQQALMTFADRIHALAGVLPWIYATTFRRSS